MSSIEPNGNVPAPGDGTDGTDGDLGLAPIPAEPTPWVSQPKYGQYAVGGAPVSGDRDNSRGDSGAYQSLPYAPTPPSFYDIAKPGIVPLRPLKVADILGGAWAAIWHNPGVMVGLSLLVVLASGILSVLIGLAFSQPVSNWVTGLMADLEHNFEFQQALTTLNTNFAELSGSINQAAGLVAQGAGAALLLGLAGPIINGILALSVSRSVLGDRISRSTAWSRVKGRIGALIGWSILWGLMQFAALALLLAASFGLFFAAFSVSSGLAVAVALLAIALGILYLWAYIKLMFVAPIIAVERASIGQAIRRSWALTRGNFWPILGVSLLAGILTGFVSSMIATPFTMLAMTTGLSGVAVLLLELARFVVTSGISLIFGAGVLNLLYLNSRFRNEGLHNTLIATTNGS